MYNCKLCGRPCSKDAIVCVEPFVYTICRNCHSLAGTCNLCSHSLTCDFETNPSPLPKQVQQTIRQGNMTMQSVVMNPERIRETCQKNCKCWNDEMGCLRQNGTCGQYKEVIPNAEM